MIIAYHAIFTTYGTWLPNDPRGSYSREVYNEQLKLLGDIQYGRQDPQPDGTTKRRFWTESRKCLERPPYFINDRTRPIVGESFARTAERLGEVVHACAIMNDHVHLVVRRGGHRIEYLVGQFKANATCSLRLRLTPWATGSWRVFLDDEETVRAAVRYVEANPTSAGWGEQRWEWVTRLQDWYDDWDVRETDAHKEEVRRLGLGVGGEGTERDGRSDRR
ncbi:MAG: hypothetical protein NT031_04800 [Planctomycetota bacterium]|nr:hypothetical protein [Planctomycetota bacterium]